MPLRIHAKEAPQANSQLQPQRQTQPTPPVQREEDALYQKGQIVARATGAEIKEGTKEIRFEELYNSDDLLLPDPCEFQRYQILIRKIAYSTKVGKESAARGRVLGGVKAEILGYRQ